MEASPNRGKTAAVAPSELGKPANAAQPLAEVTRFLLTLAPYLDLLDEGGLSPRPTTAAGPPADGNAGTAKTCPG
jgi:hypothetical protein